ncbi:Rv2175c family DNA-binding protein [[Mycobacterium] vasticus]|uniref:Rv2175c family DNA-binding protein n=1 Tax=[Mycobacterium] vasticus TaxID=2875777 RepID=A0ABU5Z0X4_9MYCO|nr:Rv2175c family DNA-binding protein [Mycolicibacter sp. MYC017]MEB3071051.1 Rv2175c family DNA-binding protein [Mycolicibacter sp. MYC017]
MSSIPAAEDVLEPDEPTFDLPHVAQMLGLPVTKVHQYLRESHLMAVRRDGVLLIPQLFFTEDGDVVKSLPGLLSVLGDGGYRPTEILSWLFTPDSSLSLTHDGVKEVVANARPIDALHAHQAREVMRRAQAMAY